MKSNPVVIGVVVALGAIAVGYAASGPISSKKSQSPTFTHPTAISHPYLPLAQLHVDVLEGEEGGHHTRVERSRKPGTKAIRVNGQEISTLVMEDRETVAGKLTEITRDYFAQSDDGAVYYLGEDVDEYKNGKIVGHDGAWIAGVKNARPGVILPAHPKVGDRFMPENAPGVTWERDEIVSISETVTVPAGTFKQCVKIKEILSDGEVEYKYYAPRVGVVKEVPHGGELRLMSHT